MRLSDMIKRVSEKVRSFSEDNSDTTNCCEETAFRLSAWQGESSAANWAYEGRKQGVASEVTGVTSEARLGDAS